VRQPWRGIVGTLLVMLISLGFIAIFPAVTFTTWVAYLMTCLIPTVIVITVFWGVKHPRGVARIAQPGRGLLFTVIVLVVGALVSVVHLLTVGGARTPPAPMPIMAIITSVTTTFWLAIIWGGWPFTARRLPPVLGGLLLLVAAYLLNGAIYRGFSSFAFMEGTPAYVRELDPRGLFDAWNALVLQVTAIAAMFLVLNFDLWPFSRSPALMRQPLLGALWTLAVLAVGAAALVAGTRLLKADAVQFMVEVPIPFIFGTIVVVNMMQRTLFQRFAQPLRGLLVSAAAAAVGVALAALYRVLAPIVSGPLAPGAPAHALEIWIASALLSVTFPFLILFAEIFQFWPLLRDTSSPPS
jgi:hypothetical protein